ncbi:hypothetical protein [Thiolapillus sp.]|uniref:hypothetical protein n=1 Tax=Thiolapillus sp. TaxID=2017437 RepID=UPI003AF871FE
MTGRRVRRPTLFSLWRKARRENSAASRLLGSTSLRFALHGWQRLNGARISAMSSSVQAATTWHCIRRMRKSNTTRRAGSMMKAPGGGYCQSPANLNCSWRFSSRS